MLAKIKKYQRTLLVILIVIGTGIILAGGIGYFYMLQSNLTASAIQDVMNVTMQQQQAFDSFISRDRERLHEYADYFSQNSHDNPEEIRNLLPLLRETDAACVVICLDEGWACNSMLDGVFQLDEDELNTYRSLSSSGIRDNFIGVFSGASKFGYYETFTFSDGHKGLIEKGYDRSMMPETFTLSLYNGQGYGYILDRNGDILLRSVQMSGSQVYDNVFDALTNTHNPQEDIDALRAAINQHETGSIIFEGDNGRFIYTFTPVKSVENWELLSIVPVDAIRAESDKIMRSSRITLILLGLVAVVCALFGMLIRRTNRDMEAKDQEVKYQTQLFHIFTTYLSNNTDDMYMMLDHETERLEYVSPNVERVLGVSRENVIDAFEASDMSADSEAAKAYYAEINALTPGQSSKPRRTERINPKTGEHKYFLESAYCAVIQGRVKRVVYISDRTKERKAQDSLSEALHMAQAASAAKSAFLSNVSHDIRTPMNSIIGFLTLIRDEADNPELVKEYSQRIDAASQHLLGLINDVLDMNKIESGSATLNISEMNLAEIIDEINTIIRHQTRDRNQTFDIFVSHMRYEHLLGDKLRINQVLINLLSNAVKYTPENGTIQLRVEELPQIVDNYSRIRFTVSDNGMGMSEDYLKVIFDPFTREETEVIHQIQGTGLGMAITKSLVDLMGGNIQVKSELGKGSTFMVELQLRIQEREEEDPGFWKDHKVTKMIVADDDEEICRNIVKAMSRTGVTVDYATDGGTAVAMMRSARKAGNPYNLILLDWQMPNMNGVETARLIRKNYPDNIPIFFFTAYDWSEIEHEAAEIGVNHFMPKPFFMSTFKDAIRRVMGSQEKKEEKRSNVVEGMHILVVDDLAANRLILVKILSTLGADCDTACNGQEAAEKFSASQPGEYDLILMDVQMPVMDGYTATRTIRGSSHPSALAVPIIAMTANAFADDVRNAIESGMNAHVAKPVQRDKLCATIQQVLEDQEQSKKR
ncbi:MAG: response regulator [Lachnospiraceae bacterium]|nr:response regulator [Lachnospiraceae bacterium]